MRGKRKDEEDVVRNLIFAILCIVVFDWRSLARVKSEKEDEIRGRLSIREFVLTSLQRSAEQPSFCGKFERSDGCADWLLKMKGDAPAAARCTA